MQRDDWRRAFGETPGPVAARIADTLRNLEEEKPVRKMSFRVVLIAAIITLLLVGTAFAVANEMGLLDASFFGLFSSLTEDDVIQIADQPSAETDLVRYTVTEAAVNDNTLVVAVRVELLDPDKYLFWEERDKLADYLEPGSFKGSSFATLGDLIDASGRKLVGAMMSDVRVNDSPLYDPWESKSSTSDYFVRDEDGAFMMVTRWQFDQSITPLHGDLEINLKFVDGIIWGGGIDSMSLRMNDESISDIGLASVRFTITVPE